MKIFIFACLMAVAVAASILEEQGENFQTFKLTYNKIYRNQAEEAKRFNIFKNNILSIEEHNALYEQGLVFYKQGINKFTDMTQEEFRAMLTLSVSNRPNLNATRHVKTGLEIPDSIDWRTQGQVTDIKDQGSCGSCWSFSITGSTEAAYFRKSGKLVSLSEQQLVDCSTDINFGCGGGYLDATMPYVQQYGLQSENSYSYTGQDGVCKYSPSDVVTKISGFKAVDSGDEDTLLDAVGNVGPVSIAMDALSLSFYESGIYDDEYCSALFLDHAVLVVGYGSENGKDFWIVKNSWGKSWGEEGFFRLARGKNECGVAQDAVYPSCD